MQELHNLKEVIKRSFLDVRLEMDDHLSTINQNTSEIQSLFDYLREIDSKINKMNERIDELFMFIAPEKNVDFNSIKLTRNEKEIYLVFSFMEGPVTPDQVGKKLGLNKQLAAQYLYNLQLKGIPMIARNWNGEMFYSLDLKFKDLQERKNILRIPDNIINSVKNIIR